MTIREIIDSILDSTPGEIFREVFVEWPLAILVFLLILAVSFAVVAFFGSILFELFFGRPFTTYP